jgi:hypothetical protein
MKKIVYVDMDGVLADFDAYVEEKAGVTVAELEKQKPKDPQKFKDSVEEFMETYIKKEMFANFDSCPFLAHMNLYLRNKPNDVDFVILSAASSSNYEEVVRQKKKWLNAHGLGGMKYIFVKRSVDKAKYANPNCLLFDDRKKALDPWILAGGKAIKVKVGTKENLFARKEFLDFINQ